MLQEVDPTTYYFNTFTYTSIAKHSKEHVASFYDHLYVRKYKKFVFPIHTASHWSLIVVKDNQFLGFDSLVPIRETIFVKIRLFLVELFKRQNLAFKIVIGLSMCDKVPMQTNTDDCGVFTCAYARFYVVNEYDDNLFSNRDINKYRSIILHELLAGKILDYKF